MYADELRKSTEAGTDKILSGSHGPDAVKKRAAKFPPITAHARRLAIGAKATKLSRFDRHMQKLGYKTIVQDMEGYRTKGHTAEWVVNMVRRKADPVPHTRLQRLQFLADGSPTLRYILHQIKELCLLAGQPLTKQQSKLLITEDVPLIAWYWELCLNYLYIHTETLHSGLSFAQRVDLVNRFNNPESSPKVMNLMYTVGSQGTNLDQGSHRVLVSTAALNAPLEIQAWGRVIRVGTPSRSIWSSMC